MSETTPPAVVIIGSYVQDHCWTTDRFPAVGETRVSGLRNSAAMTGFEDTQLLEPDDVASPLSSTQFGDL